MSKRIQLHIPEPCHENWDKMTPVEKGRFCNACQKQVVDFTGMSDEQMIAFFRKPTTGSVCGRFIGDQLNRDIVVPKKRIPWVKYFFQFALPAFLISFKATAQGKVKILSGDTTIITSSPAIRGKVAVGPISEKIIQGRITDNNGNGIVGAIVTIKNMGISTATDSKGYYKLNYSGHASSIIVAVSAIGFIEKERTVVINKKKVDPLIVKFKLLSKNNDETAVTAGLVVVSDK